jgi:hypothetical protein
MNDLIIINAFPNNEYKISLLESQLFYLKQLGLKILVVSGCDVPEKLRNQIDYLIINSDNVVIDKDHNSKTFFDMKLTDTSFLYIAFNNLSIGLFGKHVNVTITKNIKLSFKMAQMLGYKNVFYTEDDNIFREGAFEFIKKNLDKLNRNESKIVGILDYFADNNTIWTTFFFANIDYFLKKFTIPDTKEEYYSEENIIKYRLHKPYEVSFFEIFKNDLLNVKNECMTLIDEQSLDLSKNIRSKQKNWVFDTFANILIDTNGKYMLAVQNTAYFLNDEDKKNFEKIEFDLYINDQYIMHHSLNLNCGYFRDVYANEHTFKIVFKDLFEKEIKVDFNTIKNTGFVIRNIYN